MKKKIFGLYIVLIASLTSAIIASVSEALHWITGGLGLIALTSAFLVLDCWFGYLSQLLKKSDSVLNKKEQNKRRWSFSNIDELKINHDQIEVKFYKSAALITNLAQVEKLGTVSDLDVTDPIGKALHTIKAEMQKLKEEDEKRGWITQGLANFGEVLRNKKEIKEYAYQIISSLVKYLEINQGGLYFEYHDEGGEPYLEPMACYAYDKRKFASNRITMGQGMLGQCMLEKEIINITDIPKDYVKITSGLGESTPRNIIVVPLLFNDKFCGAIELAAFTTLQPYQLDFLKKVSENIASEIAAMKNLEHSKALLEESNTLTQELQSREEEMRQNLEELAATQQEMARKQTELSGIINAIDSTLATAEFSVGGRLIKHNAILEKFFGHSTGYLKNKDYTLITGMVDKFTWQDILDGKIRAGDFKVQSQDGLALWLSVTFTPIREGNNLPMKVLCMIQNITQKKIKENEFERLSLVANNTDNAVIITNEKGYIEYVNEGFTKMTGYVSGEVIGKKPKLLQGPLTDQTTIQRLSKYIAAGEPVYEEILNYTKTGESYWVSLAINAVKDSQGKISKFISVQANITETKIKSLDFHQKMEALGRANAIIEMDLKGNIIEMNENYLNLLQYAKAEVIGKPYTMFLKKESTFEKLIKTVEEQGLQSGVYSRYDKHGNQHQMKLIDYPVFDIYGKLEKIIEFGVDVSNEKRLEKEAERKQAELNGYLHGINNTIASAEFTKDGTFTSGNEIFLKVMGFTAEELQGNSFSFLMGEDPNVVMMWENIRLGKYFSGEFKMKNKTGKELWLNGTFNPIIIDSDKPDKILMFAQFTTQEKEKLNDLNAIVHALKATLPVIEFGVQFECKTANEKAQKIFNIPRLELRSKTIYDFIAPHYHMAWKKIQDDINAKDFSSFVIPFFTGSQVVNYEVSISVLKNMEGRVVKIIMLLVKEVSDKVSLLAAAS